MCKKCYYLRQLEAVIINQNIWYQAKADDYKFRIATFIIMYHFAGKLSYYYEYKRCINLWSKCSCVVTTASAFKLNL